MTLETFYFGVIAAFLLATVLSVFVGYGITYFLNDMKKDGGDITVGAVFFSFFLFLLYESIVVTLSAWFIIGLYRSE